MDSTSTDSRVEIPIQYTEKQLEALRMLAKDIADYKAKTRKNSIIKYGLALPLKYDRRCPPRGFDLDTDPGKLIAEFYESKTETICTNVTCRLISIGVVNSMNHQAKVHGRACRFVCLDHECLTIVKKKSNATRHFLNLHTRKRGYQMVIQPPRAKRQALGNAGFGLRSDGGPILYNKKQLKALHLLAEDICEFKARTRTSSIIKYGLDLPLKYDRRFPPHGLGIETERGRAIAEFYESRTEIRCKAPKCDVREIGFVNQMNHQIYAHGRKCGYVCLDYECLTIVKKSSNAKRHFYKLHVLKRGYQVVSSELNAGTSAAVGINYSEQDTVSEDDNSTSEDERIENVEVKASKPGENFVTGYDNEGGGMEIGKKREENTSSHKECSEAEARECLRIALQLLENTNYTPREKLAVMVISCFKKPWPVTVQNEAYAATIGSQPNETNDACSM